MLSKAILIGICLLSVGSNMPDAFVVIWVASGRPGVLAFVDVLVFFPSKLILFSDAGD